MTNAQIALVTAQAALLAAMAAQGLATREDVRDALLNKGVDRRTTMHLALVVVTLGAGAPQGAGPRGDEAGVWCSGGASGAGKPAEDCLHMADTAAALIAALA